MRFVFVFIVDIDMNWEPVAADQFWAPNSWTPDSRAWSDHPWQFFCTKEGVCEYIGAKSILYQYALPVAKKEYFCEYPLLVSIIGKDADVAKEIREYSLLASISKSIHCL